jgi:hypothetical protein
LSKRIENALEKHKKLGEETKKKILSLIFQSEPAGMSTDDLVKATKRNRRTIHAICKKYEDNGILLKTGTFGKYHLGPKSREDIHLKAFFFQEKIFDKFFFLAGTGASTSSKYFNYQNYGHMLHFSKERLEYNENFSKRNRDLDDLYLYEYSLKLGASLTYQLIQSIKYAQQEPDLDQSRRDRIILKWVENIVNPLSILDSFSRLNPVYKRMQIPKKNTSDFKPSFFELQSVKVAEIEKIFENVFPELFKDLEKINHSIEVEDKVQGAKNHALELVRLGKSEKKIKHLEKDDPTHVKCGGELEPMLHIHNNGQYVKRCSKCSRWVPVKESKPIG